MPYFHDCYKDPSRNDDWDAFWDMWQDIKHDLLSTYFETKDEALVQKNRAHKDDGQERFINWHLIPYRKTNDYDQLRHYHELGLEELSYTEDYLERDELGAKFAFHWGRLTACHGYVLAHALVQGNDLTREVGGGKSVDINSTGTNRESGSRIIIFAQNLMD